MYISCIKKAGVVTDRVPLKSLSMILALTSSLISPVNAAPGPEAVSPVPTETRGTLQLLEYEYPSQGSGHREWIVHCTIPVPVMTSSSSEVAVMMDSNGYGCKNDEAEGFKLVGASSAITMGFFDSKCNDAGRYNDDNYQYNIRAANATFGPFGSFEPAVPEGTDTGGGLVYWFGKKVNGIDGKLSCVSFWPYSNAGVISGN
jgi:hypothetical protein